IIPYGFEIHADEGDESIVAVQTTKPFWAVPIVRTAEGEWKLYLYLDPVVWFVAFYSSEETDI
ncbi:1157_t:CDS:2, partial [Dentiscutata erythropus]